MPDDGLLSDDDVWRMGLIRAVQDFPILAKEVEVLAQRLDNFAEQLKRLTEFVGQVMDVVSDVMSGGGSKMEQLTWADMLESIESSQGIENVILNDR